MTYDVEILLEVDYVKRLDELKHKYGGKFYSHKAKHLVFDDREGIYLGDVSALIQIAKDYGIEDPDSLYDDIGNADCAYEETKKALNGSDTVFIKFAIKSNDEETVLNKVVIQL